MNAYIAGTDSLYVRLFLYREAGMCYEIKTEDHTRFPDDHISYTGSAKRSTGVHLRMKQCRKQIMILRLERPELTVRAYGS